MTIKSSIPGIKKVLKGELDSISVEIPNGSIGRDMAAQPPRKAKIATNKWVSDNEIFKIFMVLPSFREAYCQSLALTYVKYCLFFIFDRNYGKDRWQSSQNGSQVKKRGCV
jgi:hypothetical protein